MAPRKSCLQFSKNRCMPPPFFLCFLPLTDQRRTRRSSANAPAPSTCRRRRKPAKNRVSLNTNAHYSKHYYASRILFPLYTGSALLPKVLLHPSRERPPPLRQRRRRRQQRPHPLPRSQTDGAHEGGQNRQRRHERQKQSPPPLGRREFMVVEAGGVGVGQRACGNVGLRGYARGFVRACTSSWRNWRKMARFCCGR